MEVLVNIIYFLKKSFFFWNELKMVKEKVNGMKQPPVLAKKFAEKSKKDDWRFRKVNDKWEAKSRNATIQ